MCIGKYYTYMLGVYVTRSVFSTAVGERTSFNELLNFFEKNRSRTAMCLIVRAADNPINSQAVVKKRLSKFELLKCCCRIFQQRLQTDFVSNQRAIQVLQRIASAANLQYTFARKKGCQFFVRHVSDIWCSRSLQSVCCGSQAVEYSQRHYAQFRYSPQIISCIAR